MDFTGQQVGSVRLIEEIGHGSYATVYLGEHIVTGDKVAVKVVDRARLMDSDTMNRLQREISLLRAMDHVLIARLFQSIHKNGHQFLIMEYACNGNLLSFVNKHGRLVETLARKYFVQIISALEYLHRERKVAHRDLKPENVLLDKNSNIRLVDFGLSNTFSEEHPDMSTICGSPAYIAPEMLKGQSYTTAVDIWSAGVLLYVITVGKVPFEDENPRQLLTKILETPVVFPPFLSPPLRDLITRMLAKSPSERISIEKIKEHPWFSPMEYQCIDQFAKAAMTKSNDPINESVVAKMKEMDIDVTMLRQNMFMDMEDEAVVIYNILRRSMITEELHEALQQKILVESMMERQTKPQTFQPRFISDATNTAFSHFGIGVSHRVHRFSAAGARRQCPTPDPTLIAPRVVNLPTRKFGMIRPSSASPRGNLV